MTRLASYFRGKADDARVARVWGTLDERFERAARRRPLRLWLLASITCAAAALLLSSPFEARHAQQGMSQVIELADGSRVAHAAQDRIEIAAVTPERVELRMTRGRAQFRVARNPKRAFLTRAGGHTIRVIGTEYAIDLDASSVRVEVSRGEVEVRRDGSADVWRVRAGEVWSSSCSVLTAKSAAREVPHPAPAAAQLPDTGTSTPEDPAAKPSAASIRPGATSSAAALFQRAQEARVAGQRDETARLLSEFVRRFPDDPRAGLAAFELGRLRLDAGDEQGAIEALDHAERAGAALGEQVQARRVQAFEQLGDVAGCRAARAAFLERFPDGTFAEIVRHRCP
jgi:TolA-binding protein